MLEDVQLHAFSVKDENKFTHFTTGIPEFMESSSCDDKSKETGSQNAFSS